MKTRDAMTSNVITVSATTPITEVARLMLANHISAVPVTDATGCPIGMVSEGDLIGRDESEREARKDWWLELLAEGEALSPDFLSSVHDPERVAGDVMSRPVITVDEDTDVGEIARLLQSHRIKRVPVVRDGQVVGIVSRENLLRTLVMGNDQTGTDHEPDGLAGVFSGLVEQLKPRFINDLRASGPTPGSNHANSREEGVVQTQNHVEPSPEHAEPAVLSTDLLHKISEETAMKKAEEALGKMKLEEQQKKSLHDAFMSREPPPDALEHLMETVRRLAEQGETELLALQFPASYLDDNGRRINNLEPDWPTSLTGFARRAFEFYEKNLKPHGYKVRAQILDFPGGMPGNVGLYLVW